MAESLMFQWHKQLLLENGARQLKFKKKEFPLHVYKNVHPIYLRQMLLLNTTRDKMGIENGWWENEMQNVDWFLICDACTCFANWLNGKANTVSVQNGP